MNVCGKPAAYVGVLATSANGEQSPRIKGAFCEGCTKGPFNRRRSFVSDRPARHDEKCDNFVLTIS